MADGRKEEGYIIRNICSIRIQKNIPITVGRSMAAAVHLRLPLSFFMVRQVVEHGQ